MFWLTNGILFCTFLFSVICLWSKRKFYYLSWNMKGPMALPFIGNAWLFLDPSCTINVMSTLGHKYGSLARFWLGSKLLVYINSPEDMETLVNSETQDKGNVYDNISDLIGGHGLLSLNGNAWKTHRKLLNHTVQHYSILYSFSPIFDEKIKTLIEILSGKDGDTFNIYSYIEAAAAEIVCNTTFGVNMKLQQNQNKNFLDAVNDGTFVVGLKTLKPWYQIKLVMRLSKYHKIYNRSKSTIKEFVKKIYAQKLLEFNNEITNNQNTGPSTDEFGIKQNRNFIDECIRLTVTEKLFNEQDSITESITMLLAGFETTAGTVSNAILMLAMHPEYQQKVYEEIVKTVPNGQTTVTANVINQLDYTDRLIKETLRLFPIIPMITRIARNDMTIGQHNIPTGTEFILSLFDLHRKPSIWGQNANKFDPNNFLPEKVAQRHPHAFVPFAFGSRNCVGVRYANIVVRLIVASLVRNFIFTTEEKYEDLRFRWAITLKLDNGYIVKVTKRHCS